LVNLSEPISRDMVCDPRLVVTTSGKHCPGDAGELVGERDRQQIAMSEALAGPCRTVMPRSMRKPRIWLITAVRWPTSDCSATVVQRNVSQVPGATKQYLPLAKRLAHGRLAPG
jgi:hypothetical protein